MPIYEYSCSNCHHTFDALQKLNDEPITICPKCSKATVSRLVSAAGFQLKGSGWYATDFKNKGKSQPTSEAKTESKDSKTSDAKPKETSTTTKGETD